MTDYTDELKIFDKITFNEKAHTYFIDGQPAAPLSVTKTIKCFKKEFNADEAATRISKRSGATVQQIKEEWNRNRDCSAAIGTLLHKYIERHYTQTSVDDVSVDFDTLGFDEKQRIKETVPLLIEQFLLFYEHHPHLKCIKSEFVVGDIEDTKICGTFDMLVYNEETNEVELLDFKTNKRMQRANPFGGNLFYPFEHMAEGEINEYTIQLNIYKYLVEKYTNVKIDKMKLIWFNAQNQAYQIFELKEIQNQIKLMFDRIKANELFRIQ